MAMERGTCQSGAVVKYVMTLLSVGVGVWDWPTITRCCCCTVSPRTTCSTKAGKLMKMYSGSVMASQRQRSKLRAICS